MANKVTGSTDTSGALTTAPSIMKSILVVGTKKENSTTEIKENTILASLVLQMQRQHLVIMQLLRRLLRCSSRMVLITSMV